MSPKTVITTTLAILAIVLGVFAYAQFSNKPSPSLASLSSSSSVLSSPKVTSSSTQVTSQHVSSMESSSVIVAPISKVESSSKVADSDNKTTACNLPESENLVKTDEGCFNLYYNISDIGLFKFENTDFEIARLNRLFSNRFPLHKNFTHEIRRSEILYTNSLSIQKFVDDTHKRF